MARFFNTSVPFAAALAGLVMCASPAAQGFEFGFAMDVLDPGYCLMPPAELTDEELLAMLDGGEVSIPIEGMVSGVFDATLAGDAYFGRDDTSDAIVTTILLLVRHDDDRFSGLCMALLPVDETASADGEMPLLGLESEAPGGDAYMAFSRLIERDGDGETHVLTEIETTLGTIRFTDDDGEIISGDLTLTGVGRDDGPYQGEIFEIAFEFMLFDGLDDFSRIEAIAD